MGEQNVERGLRMDRELVLSKSMHLTTLIFLDYFSYFAKLKKTYAVPFSLCVSMCIIAREFISAAEFINSSHQSVCLCVSLSLLG
jgi:hypothetical protein